MRNNLLRKMVIVAVAAACGWLYMYTKKRRKRRRDWDSDNRHASPTFPANGVNTKADRSNRAWHSGTMPARCGSSQIFRGGTRRRWRWRSGAATGRIEDEACGRITPEALLPPMSSARVACKGVSGAGFVNRIDPPSRSFVDVSQKKGDAGAGM